MVPLLPLKSVQSKSNYVPQKVRRSLPCSFVSLSVQNPLNSACNRSLDDPLPPHRVSEQAEENKMTASNLGIIFGPTLIKPRQTDAEVSLSSLVDYPYQALLVEMMVRHFLTVFDTSLMPAATADLSAGGQASPRLTPQEKLQRLSRHSTSLVDIKEVRENPCVPQKKLP